MKIIDIMNATEAEVLTGEDQLELEVYSACASDMMSDVLAFVKEQAVLITGLVNPQVVRTAEMMDMQCIVFVRGKKPDAETLTLAKKKGLVVLASKLRMYTACGLLFSMGLHGGTINAE
ncbi:MAG: DRTGG domain-containing protein [Clostridia bacterium]|nr:DRTGG domain-containing protein [Clostridia bacterium]